MISFKLETATMFLTKRIYYVVVFIIEIFTVIVFAERDEIPA